MPVVLAIALLALVGGGVVAAIFAGGSGGHSANAPARVTVTAPGATVVETVTTQPSPSSPPTAAAATASTSATVQAASSASSLPAQGYQRLQAGDPAGALPLLEQAAQQLQGANSLSEAYNDYNLAVALAQTQGCSTQVLQLLDQSEAIQGHRSEINQLRKACRKHGNG